VIDSKPVVNHQESITADFCNKIGTKRTSESTQPMSAFGGKADIAQTSRNVRF
jgi:hypothetical protein